MQNNKNIVAVFASPHAHGATAEMLSACLACFPQTDKIQTFSLFRHYLSRVRIADSASRLRDVLSTIWMTLWPHMSRRILLFLPLPYITFLSLRR